MADTDLRMNAYYYSFEPTGVREIDVILSAVARAGKCYHHTEGWIGGYWSDEPEPPEEPFTGDSWIDRIQNAANAAALAMREPAAAPMEDTDGD